jgi:hypothetical protein
MALQISGDKKPASLHFQQSLTNTHGKSEKETPLEDEQAQTPEALQSLPSQKAFVGLTPLAHFKCTRQPSHRLLFL